MQARQLAQCEITVLVLVSHSLPRSHTLGLELKIHRHKLIPITIARYSKLTR